MKIIHIAQQAKQADYASTGEIVQEIARTLARNEGAPQVLQIYTYPEEAFLKRGTQFFSQGEIDSLCRDLQSLMGEYPCAVLCLGILRSETIAGKLFLINSALVFYRQNYAAFDKQVVSDVDTVWRHCTARQTISKNFIGDYIDGIRGGLARGNYSHTYFVPLFPAGVPGTPETPHTFSQMSIKTDYFCFPERMLTSELMCRTLGTPEDWRWKNYMLIPTQEKTVALWVGICMEIPSKNFLQRYQYWRPQIHFDTEVAVILTNDLTLGHNIGVLPRIPLLYNDKHNRFVYTGRIESSEQSEQLQLQAYDNGIIEV